MTAPDRDMIRALVREAVREAVAELKTARPAMPRADAAPLAGVVTEKTVAALSEGATLRLAPDAVVTPLARDRARARRIRLERIR